MNYSLVCGIQTLGAFSEVLEVIQKFNNDNNNNKD